MLTRSDNTTAELLAKEIARAAGRSPTTAEAAEVVAGVVRPLLDDAGVPGSDVAIIDGSGLDPGNHLTCRALVALLQRFGPDSTLAAGLAVAGRTGTLEARFQDSAAAGRFKGKTGNIRDVLTLSGFVDGAGGRVWTFALLANGPRADAEIVRWRPVVEAMVAAPAGPDPEALAPLPARGA
jgi:D-alanyl-D-alanine carboxypeptidase/D-alanyl-D-alanine-endopeptidase (penicillin-binding protein 4)